MRGYKQEIENELWGMLSAGVFLIVMCTGTILAAVFMIRYLFE
jgi:hypothetical protein